MTTTVAVRPAAGQTIESTLLDLLTTARPHAVGMATAYLNLPGAIKFRDLVRTSGAGSLRVVIGTSGAVTHPKAIVDLIDAGYDVRLGTGDIFHPKLLCGGGRFIRSGTLHDATCAYIGSANFTRAGFVSNTEVALATRDRGIATSTADAFSQLWKDANRPTKGTLKRYEAEFAIRQSRRSASDLFFLDVAEAASHKPLIDLKNVEGVWVGMETVTGFNNQIEFPKRPAEALTVLLGTGNGFVTIQCSDGRTRRMKYAYYGNAMYRLNVPRDVPGVDVARATKTGALIVWRDKGRRGAINTEVLFGKRLSEVVARSKALGCWGTTSTREYGWY